MKAQERLPYEEIEDVPEELLQKLIKSYWADGAVKIEVLPGNQADGIKLRVFFKAEAIR